MPYRLPVFNLMCNISTAGTYPAVRLAVMCNLAFGKRVQVSSTGGTGAPGVQVMTMYLLLPALTDVRGANNASGQDRVEVPAGSGVTYDVTQVLDIGKGFANEHRVAMLTTYSIGGAPFLWPTPIP